MKDYKLNEIKGITKISTKIYKKIELILKYILKTVYYNNVYLCLTTAKIIIGITNKSIMNSKGIKKYNGYFEN